MSDLYARDPSQSPEPEREGEKERPIPPLGEPGKISGDPRYADAWAQGVEHATGAPCTAPTATWELGAIHRAILKHFKGKRGEDLLLAIRQSATDYAKHHAGKILKAEHWLTWLNSNRPTATAPQSPLAQEVGRFHHSSLLSGEPVAAAGELRVVSGKVESLSDRSGHYQPGAEFTKQAVDSLNRAGVNTSNIRLVLTRPAPLTGNR